jgi:hypothetical protein
VAAYCVRLERKREILQQRCVGELALLWVVVDAGGAVDGAVQVWPSNRTRI